MPAPSPDIAAAAAEAAGDLLVAGGTPLQDLLAALPSISHHVKAYGGSEGGAALARALASVLGDGDLSATEMDELGAWSLVVASVVALLVLGAMVSAVGSAAFGGGGLIGGGADAGDRVLLLGPCRGGKTTLMYRLGGVSKAPTTVTTMVPTDNMMLVDEDDVGVAGGGDGDDGEDEAEGGGGGGGGDRDAKRLKVTDFPGHARMWSALREHLPSARVVLFVVDAADLKSSSVQTAAELLFEVLTDARFCDAHEESGGIVVACNKADLATAKGTDEVKRLLEAELDQLRVTRNAMGRVGASGGGLNDNNDGGEDDDGSARRIPLGQTGVKFSFASSAPCRVEFCSCSAKGKKVGVEDLRSVVVDVFFGEE